MPSISAIPRPTRPQTKDTASSSAQPKSRTLILCFDGTANQFDGDNTNVVKFYSLLKKDIDDEQLCYYQPGIGTYFNPGVVSPIFQWCAKILDEAFAWYLDAHVRGGYQFLMQNYVAGDKICIFGFSRGAYTARALAGMLHKIGLLPKDNPEQVPFAYKLFKQTDSNSVTLAAGFKQTFCRDVKIEFVGVWETVSSVGVIMNRTLPFTTANTTIQTFRHALSLDEHRVKFQPNLYHYTSAPSDMAVRSAGARKRAEAQAASRAREGKAKAAGDVAKSLPPPAAARQKSVAALFRRRAGRAEAKGEGAGAAKPAPLDLEAAARALATTSTGSGEASSSSDECGSDDEIDGGTDVLEVWFAGCHSDVGGGAVTDDTKESLADITLRWMVREVALAQCGIAFDEAALARANIPDSVFQLPPPPAGDAPASGAGDPLDEDPDALQPIHDELQIDKLWWLLEILPLTHDVCTDGKWQTKWWIHLGRGRQLPDAPKFHVSVRERLQDANLKYTPKATWAAGTETWAE